TTLFRSVSGQPRQPKPRFHQHQVHPANQPLPENSKRQLKSLLTGPATDTQEENQRPAVSQAQTAAAPQEITPEERMAADNHYILHRKQSGSEINHHCYSETLLHRLPFAVNDGDIVEVDPQQRVRGLPTIRRVTGDQLPDYQPEKVTVIEYAELKPVPGSDVLQIS